MASLPKPPPLTPGLSDKLQHFLTFAGLSALAVSAYPRTRLLLIGLGLSALGLLIEVIQLIPMLNRSSEFADFLADVAAIIVVLALTFLLRRWRRTLHA